MRINASMLLHVQPETPPRDSLSYSTKVKPNYTPTGELRQLQRKVSQHIPVRCAQPCHGVPIGAAQVVGIGV